MNNKNLYQIKAWWSKEGGDYADRIELLNSNIQEYEDQIDTVKSQKSGFNIAKILANAWSRATLIPPIKKELNKTKDERDNIHSFLSETLKEDADTLLQAISSTDAIVNNALHDIRKRSTTAKEERHVLSDVHNKTRNLLSIIHRAWQEADEAQDWETMDMIGGNAAFTLLSHSETDEAVQHLKKVGQAIKEYKQFMNDTKEKHPSLTLSPLRENQIQETAEWDLWMGVFDIDIISFFTSWRNHEQLGNAKNKLESLQAQIQPIERKFSDLLSQNMTANARIIAEYKNLRSDTIKGLDLPTLFYDYLAENTNGKNPQQPTNKRRPS